MKALILLAVGAVLMFCLIVLLASGVLVARKQTQPMKEGESHIPRSDQRSVRGPSGNDLTPPPSQRIEAGARNTAARSVTPNCAGQTGHNFGPCPDHRVRLVQVQAP